MMRNNRRIVMAVLGAAAIALAGELCGEEQPTDQQAPSTWRFRSESQSQAGSSASQDQSTHVRFATSTPTDEASPTASKTAAAIGGQRYQQHATVDPVKTNGPIFVGWPKPDVALLFSGEQNGYLEPCGCAGLENQKGGTMRRGTLIAQLRANGWPVVAMDLGGHEKRFGPQAEIKFNVAMQALMKMGYAAVGFGPQDLRMDLLSLVINMDEGSNPFVSANVGIVDFDSGFTKRYRIVDEGGLRIGITSVLGRQEVLRFRNSEELQFVDPAQAIQQVLPALRSANCDHLVLLSFADPDETRELAQRFPEFDWVVTAHGAEEPPNAPAPIDGTDSHLVEVGRKAMYVAVVGLYKHEPTAFRYQRVPLDARFADAPDIHTLFTAYQKELETLGLDGLGVRAATHPTGRKFAGSESCADCHTAATEVFIDTPHAHAIETLMHLDPPRHFDPECVSCHVTGWEPQKYFPFVSGYLNLQQTPEMVGNGCENCHGPSAEHAAAENGDIDADDDELERLRAQLRLEIVENEGNMDGQEFARGRVVQMCMQCHDIDNSPDFDFQEYWPDVEHEGVD